MPEGRRQLSGISGLLMLVVPFLVFLFAEVGVLLLVSQAIGWWTLPVLLGTTVLGAFLLQREWRKAWKGLSDSLKTGSLPPGRTADAVLVLVGGILLILPGFLTDAIGLLLLLPVTRPAVRSALGWWAARTLQKAGPGIPGQAGVIKGEVVPDEEPPATAIPEIERPRPHPGADQ